MSKVCPKCKRELDESEFNWKIKNVRLAVHCKECSRRYIREHYKRNQLYYLAKARKRNQIYRKEVQQYIGKYLQTHPCVDCGEKDILVLEFDHKERKDKTIEVAQIIRNGLSFEKMVNEIKKCEIRCANCHRKKTAKENNNWKLQYAPIV